MDVLTHEGTLQTLREVERERMREKLQDENGTDIHYLKNVVLKLYETGVLGGGGLCKVFAAPLSEVPIVSPCYPTIFVGS